MGQLVNKGIFKTRNLRGRNEYTALISEEEYRTAPTRQLLPDGRQRGAAFRSDGSESGPVAFSSFQTYNTAAGKSRVGHAPGSRNAPYEPHSA